MLGILVFGSGIANAVRSHGSWSSAAALFVYAAGFSFAYLALDTGMGALILFACVQATMIGWSVIKGDRPSVMEWFGLIVAFAAFVGTGLTGCDGPRSFGNSFDDRCRDCLGRLFAARQKFPTTVAGHRGKLPAFRTNGARLVPYLFCRRHHLALWVAAGLRFRCRHVGIGICPVVLVPAGTDGNQSGRRSTHGSCNCNSWWHRLFGRESNAETGPVFCSHPWRRCDHNSGQEPTAIRRVGIDCSGAFKGHPLLFNAIAAVAPFNVIIDHAHGLHEGIAGGRPDKAPASFLKLFGQGS